MALVRNTTSRVEPVYLLLADTKQAADHSIGKRIGPNASFLKPSRFESVAKVCHWALLIRDKCYEVTTMIYHPTVAIQKAKSFQKPSFQLWSEARQKYGLGTECWLVGATTRSDREILSIAGEVWEERCKKKYHIFLTNCQDFVKVLFESIMLKEAERKAFRWTLSSWDIKAMPTPAMVSGRVLLKKTMIAGVGALIAVAIDEEEESGSLTKTKANQWRSYVDIALDVMGVIATISRNDRFIFWKENLSKVKGYLETNDTDESPSPQEALRAPEVDYDGYDVESVNKFVDLGFDVREITSALNDFGLNRMGSQPFALDNNATELFLKSMMPQGMVTEIEETTYSQMEMDYFSIPGSYSRGTPESIDTENSWTEVEQFDSAMPGNSSPTLPPPYSGYTIRSIDELVALGFSRDVVIKTLQERNIDIPSVAEFSFSDEDLVGLLMMMQEKAG